MTVARPRVGFLGVGWIGRSRMQAIAEAGAVEIAAVCEPDEVARTEASKLAPDAVIATSLDGLLALDLDGLVIATPSALHATQAIAALERGVAVFCQKPLGRTEAEVRAVIDAARTADRLLAVDLSYRFTQAGQSARRRVQAGDIGEVFAADLIFHNAYGPDKAWFRDPALSGGGCVMDLGVHLVDLALWTLGFPEVVEVTSSLFAGGEPLEADPSRVEDYAVATLTLATGAVVRLACSWNLPAGREAAIEAAFWGTEGGAAMRNIGGSFFDFEATLTRGSQLVEPLASPPDAWSGRAAAAWADRLAVDRHFDPQAERLEDVAVALDRIYGRSAGGPPKQTPHYRR